MFVGHYGVSFAAKYLAPAVPLWLLFLAVQWLDVVWAPLVLLGIEKVQSCLGSRLPIAMSLYFRGIKEVRHRPMIVFGLGMFAIQAYVFFGPPPASDKAAAATALVAYALFALVIRSLEQRHGRVDRQGAGYP